MSISYLQRTGVVTFDANGAGVALVRPEVGQYWAPTFVTVSTRTRNVRTAGGTEQLGNGTTVTGTFSNSYTCSAHCVLYHGAVTSLDSSSFIDETYLGWGDTSSVVSGVIVKFGEAFTAQWDGGTPFDTGIITVYGRSSSDFVELVAAMAEVIPGARFSGSSSNAMLWDYNDLSSAANVNHPLGIIEATSLAILPTDCLAELVAVQFEVTTSATVGNRYFGLRVLNGAGVSPNHWTFTVLQVLAGVVQPAGLTYSYLFSPGINNFNATVNNAIGTDVQAPIPSKLILPPGCRISIYTLNLSVAGDTWSNMHLMWRQYKTLTKMGYT